MDATDDLEWHQALGAQDRINGEKQHQIKMHSEHLNQLQATIPAMLMPNGHVTLCAFITRPTKYAGDPTGCQDSMLQVHFTSRVKKGS